MFITTPLPFVQEFVDELHETLVKYQPCAGLSRRQRLWLSFCLMGILVSNSVCWAKFERASLGNYSLAALSWMFRKSQIPWGLLLHMSVRVLLANDGITHGALVIDDSDKKRHIPPDYVVERVTLQRKPPEVRIRRLRNQSRVGTVPPSTSTPQWLACWARR